MLCGIPYVKSYKEIFQAESLWDLLPCENPKERYIHVITFPNEYGQYAFMGAFYRYNIIKPTFDFASCRKLTTQTNQNFVEAFIFGKCL